MRVGCTGRALWLPRLDGCPDRTATIARWRVTDTRRARRQGDAYADSNTEDDEHEGSAGSRERPRGTRPRAAGRIAASAAAVRSLRAQAPKPAPSASRPVASPTSSGTSAPAQGHADRQRHRRQRLLRIRPERLPAALRVENQTRDGAGPGPGAAHAEIGQDRPGGHRPAGGLPLPDLRHLHASEPKSKTLCGKDKSFTGGKAEQAALPARQRQGRPISAPTTAARSKSRAA